MKLYEIKKIKAAYDIISYCTIPLLVLYFVFYEIQTLDIIIGSLILMTFLFIKVRQLFLKKSNTKALIKHQKKLNEFKKSTQRIIIDLSKAKIKTKKTQEKILIDRNNRYEDHYETINVTTNHVSIRVKIQEESIDIQFSVECNEDDLAIAFALQKTTKFYVEMNNLENFYLDLEFLKDLYSETSPARLYRPVYLTHQSLQYFSWTYFDELLPSIRNHRLY